jgi:DNA repair exonuclease SbcCD ATPase subunit
MTEFTKDDIEHYRKQYALWTSRGRITPEELHLIGRLRDALDHIEQLQKRVEKVEDNREHIERLLCNAEKRIEELEQERRWISVEEKPKYNDDYLVLTMDEYGDSYQEVAQYIDGSFFDEYDNKIKPTYWQPLPKPPQESDE